MIRGLERASRHRSFLLFGLLAILAGFISLSVYLYQDREEERAQVARLHVQQELLEETLAAARRHALRLDVDPSARGALMTALALATARAGELDTVFDESAAVPARTQRTRAPAVPAQPVSTAATSDAALSPQVTAKAEQAAARVAVRPDDDSADSVADEDPCEELFARDPTVVECSWEFR